MKTINLKFLGTFVFLLCTVSYQAVFADILIRKDPTGTGTAPNALISTKLKTTSIQTQSIIPVTADIINGELGVFFDYSVGIATVWVEDQNGNVVDSQMLDTNTATELYIPLDGLVAGSYKLRISYGTTHLVGDFQL